MYVSFGDRKRLAAFLHMDTREFTRVYTKASDGLVHLKDRENDCPFFRDGRCIVHPARPWQCRTWPFWPENMHPLVWKRDVEGFCPGVGRGRLYGAEEIEAIMRKQVEVEGFGVFGDETGDPGAPTGRTASI